MKWILPLLMLLIIIPGLHYTGFITLFESDSPAENNRTPISPPRLQVQTLQGKDFALQQLKGKIILLNFWASWCRPCYEEFPELITAVHWGRGEIHLVAVSVDSSKQDIENFLKQLGEKPMFNHSHIHIVWDPEYKIAKQFHVLRFPETFVLDRNSDIVKKYTGLFLLEKAKPFLIKFLPVEEPR